MDASDRHPRMCDVGQSSPARIARATAAAAGAWVVEVGWLGREHPRVRGDHVCRCGVSMQAAGTPPRARGSRLHPPPGGGALRNTPACAGITALPGRLPSGDPEHPRVRGDHVFSRTARGPGAGTPPRARGSLAGVQSESPRDGNTPACAGITMSRPTPRSAVPEHPRVRGDHYPSRAVGPFPWEHPRVRGDHWRRPRTSRCGWGTPPRARGSRRLAATAGLRPRNTPACAGITGGRGRSAGRRPEHPRVRGDHSVRRSAWLWGRGTPPRARGSLDLLPRGRREQGNTPACAGITSARAARPSSGSEHPRVRGDHVGALADATGWGGTPPRARGSQQWTLP